MAKVGIDTSVYKRHSVRAASSTKAVGNGINIPLVKQHANWSQRSSTFEQYCLKPTAPQNNSTHIANSISSFRGKLTTLKSESKSTRIVEEQANRESGGSDL
ncbi:MAG: hypothetical protein EXX96DRAFT_619273 [Benjaminiella poitrasii]|nr:MAG: hypothetical protein EXX96DRAFT_619273 [Benjaminiella poitrasii]